MKSNLTIPQEKMPQATTTDWSKADKTISKYVMKDIVKKTGEGENDYVIIKKQVLVSEQDRDEYVQSFADDVGILNVLKKVALTGDASMYNAQANQGIDTTNLPDNKIDAFDVVSKGVLAFDNLPDEIKQKMTMEVFVKTFGQEKFDALMAQYVKKDDGGAK